MAVCISRAIPKCFLIEIFETDYFSNYLHQRWTTRFKQRSESDIDIGGRECVVLKNLFSLVGFGIYELSFTCRSTVIEELVEAHFESVK